MRTCYFRRLNVRLWPHCVVLAYTRIQTKAVPFGMDSGFRWNTQNAKRGRP